jgi:hypothetical protein
MVTPKGTHMLERFITKNGISATHIAHIFAEQPIHVKMLHLERRSSDDEVIISKSVIEVIWRRVAGVQPNITKLTEDELGQQMLSRWFNKPLKLEEINVEDGLVVRKVMKEDKKGDEFHFTAMGLTGWLIDFTSCSGLDEAAELAGHLVRYGLISLVHDRGKVKDHNIVTSVKAGGAGGGAGAVMVSLLPDSASTRIKADKVARRRVPSDRQGSLPNHQGRNASCPMDRLETNDFSRKRLETKPTQPRINHLPP